MTDERTITRRDFIRGTAYGAIGVAIGCRGEGVVKSRPTPGRAKVVLVRHPEAMDAAGRYNAVVIQQMLDDAVIELFGTATAIGAWREIVKPADVLGIKSNIWRFLPTPRELETAIKRRAMEAGVAERNISINDRGILNDPIFRRATALINARPLRIHHWSGIGGCIKNYIMFVSDPPSYHDDSCANLGALWKLPQVKGKTRLNILVVMRPHFHGFGPHNFNPEYTWQYKGLLVGTDPVALDSTGLRLLTAKREEFFDELPRGGTSPKHVALAETRHGIGVSDPQRIDLVTLGWTEGILI